MIYFSSYFPKLQFGKVHTGQFKHKPPSPSAVKSSAFSRSPAAILGSIRSNIVRFAYITHPGSPMIGTFPAYASINIALRCLMKTHILMMPFLMKTTFLSFLFRLATQFKQAHFVIPCMPNDSAGSCPNLTFLPLSSRETDYTESW